MKIKAVCEATGLTDRAIRYYIDEGLLSPLFTENYLGRKTFDFSDADIQQLKDICILRKFGFSIGGIKAMILNPDCIVATAQELRRRKQTGVQEEQAFLTALSLLDHSKKYTLSELAAFLSKPVDTTLPPAEEDRPGGFQIILSFLIHLVTLAITWLPVAVAGFSVLGYFLHYRYPVINQSTFLILVLILLPTIMLLLSARLPLKARIKKVIRCFLLILCLLATPVSGFLAMNAFSISQTTNHHLYRWFDSGSQVDRDRVFQDLFPARLVISDTKYYYCYSDSVFGSTCDIYAQWTLEEADFHSEIDRVTTWFEHTSQLNSATVQQEHYTCLILYSGNSPFEAATEDYHYYIFAYDASTLTVRYIFCTSDQNGADQPYYLSLDW